LGLPPIFSVSESPATLFISHEARLALKKAKITGVEYELLKGIRYGEISTEIDTPVTRVFSRFDKLAKNYLSFIYFASTIIWLR